EDGLELARDLALLVLQIGTADLHAALQAVQAIEIQRRRRLCGKTGQGRVGDEIHGRPQMTSRSARNAPAAFRFCRMDSRSCGVAPRALRPRTTSARLALVLTRWMAPPSLRISIWVLLVTTVWPPAN